jgi:hypothetical protein
MIIRILYKKTLNQRLLTKSKINCPTPLVHTSERMGFFETIERGNYPGVTCKKKICEIILKFK